MGRDKTPVVHSTINKNANENEAKLFAELTAHEQQVVQSGTGWDGEAYTDKDGLRIELVAVDGEDTRYRVFHPQPVPQDEAPAEVPAEETPAEPTPEAPAAPVETETAPTNDGTEPVAPEATEPAAEVTGSESTGEATEPTATADGEVAPTEDKAPETEPVA